MKQADINFINEPNIEGSNKAASSIRALDLLNIILKKPSTLYPLQMDFGSINSPAEITQLYKYALKLQKGQLC